MFRRHKKLAVTLAAAVVLFLSVALLFLNANRLLKHKIENALGKDFSIEHISLGLGGVDAYGIKLTKDNETVLTIDKLFLRANLLGFLRKHYSVSSLTADNPVIHLAIDENGAIENPFAGRQEEQASVTPAFEIGHIGITGGTLYLTDRRLPSTYAAIEVDNRFMEFDNLSFPLRPDYATVKLSALIKGRMAAGDFKCSGKLNILRRTVDLQVAVENLTLADDPEKGPAVRVQKMDFAIASSKENGNLYVVPDMTIVKPFFRVETDHNGNFVNPLIIPRSGSSEQGKTGLLVRRMSITDGELDYHDGKVSSPPHVTRLQSISLTMTDAAFPSDNRLSAYTLAAVIPGRGGAATLQCNGKTNFKTYDTDARIEVRNLDITGFKPYFQKKGDADVSRGLLGITMHLSINGKMINSPGRAVIRDLEFNQGKGLKDTFIGVPRNLVLKLLKTGNDEIALDFVIAGNMSDPKFNLRENFVKRLTVGLAGRLGLSVVEAGKTVVELGEKGVTEVGKGIKSIGEGIQGIFKKKKN